MLWTVYKIATHTKGRSNYEHGNFSKGKRDGKRIKGEKKK
jgi:hypothetical protein